MGTSASSPLPQEVNSDLYQLEFAGATGSSTPHSVSSRVWATSRLAGVLQPSHRRSDTSTVSGSLT
jgi:hypothetical protein